MSLGQLVRMALLGRSSMPQSYDLPLRSPQSDVTVWLHGMGAPRDVTALHCFACASPAIICIGFPECSPESVPAFIELRFRERAGSQRLLGSIHLEKQTVIRGVVPELSLYRAISCRNHCVGALRNGMRSLYVSLERLRLGKRRSVDVSSRDSRCNEVIFACPRPVVLLSLRFGNQQNIVPLNLMAAMGVGCFAMALNTRNATAASVARGARLAVSTVPFKHAEQVRGLGSNHRRVSVQAHELPFKVSLSRTLGVAVPQFALSVTELVLESSYPLGSHTLFVTRVIDQQVFGDEPEFYRIHGTCAALREQLPVGAR